MFIKLVLKLYIVFMLFINIYAVTDEKCRGPNEEWLACGPGCVRTCDDYYESIECNKPCVKGCFCKPGYVRNTKWRCVLPEHCYYIEEPPLMKCKGPNEVYNKCGTGCPLTCDNYKNPPTCIRKCVEGCFCKPGYVRDHEGYCVHPKECPSPVPPNPICKKGNETFLKCGSMCPDTCDTLGVKKKCSKKCVPGCFCKRGYVKDSNDNCILIRDCPKKEKTGRALFACDKLHEEYLVCGIGCPLTCKNMNTTSTIDCNYDCVEGCFCRTGFVRDNDGYCILPEECPLQRRHTTCRYLEQPASRKRPCAGTCDAPDECEPAPPGSCVCIEGTVRDELGQCIYPEYCPIGCYGYNEVFDCGSPCDTECDRLGMPCDIFTVECIPQCYCKIGYARDHRYQCVPLKRCPVRTPLTKILFSK